MSKLPRKLAEVDQRCIRAALLKLLEDSRNADIKKLKDQRPERWRLRVGTLRVIFTPDDATENLVVHEVFPRQAATDEDPPPFFP